MEALRVPLMLIRVASTEFEQAAQVMPVTDRVTVCVVAQAGALAALLELAPEEARRLFAGQILGGASVVGGEPAWGAPEDLYAQEWAWFATALYADALPNLWAAPRP